MSGMLLKSKGEAEYFPDDEDVEDELGDLLDQEEVDQLLLMDDFGVSKLAPLAFLDDHSISQKIRLSHLDCQEGIGGMQNSLFELDLDKDGEFDFE